jgi:hypothetical protein
LAFAPATGDFVRQPKVALYGRNPFVILGSANIFKRDLFDYRIRLFLDACQSEHNHNKHKKKCNERGYHPKYLLLSGALSQIYF